jgi:hypothetical protein
MKRKNLYSSILLAALAVLMTFGTALAHTTVTAGNYEIEVGWVDEPPVVGQRTAVVLNVSDSTDPEKEVDVSKLVISAAYGGQTKTLSLQPLSEESKNQYIAPMLPTVPGQYTLQLRGQIGADNTELNLDVQPEEVVAADVIAFPGGQAESNANSSPALSDWLAGGALLAALAALALSFLAWRRPRA